MKEIIQRIVSDLSDLTPPFNPVKLKHIFEKHPVLEIEQAPPQLIMHVKQLITLRGLIEKSFTIAAKKHSLSLQQARLIELKKQDETLQQWANEYQKQIQSTIDLLNSSFLVLKPLIKENLPERNLLISDYTASADSKSQQLVVMEFLAHVSKAIETINRNRAKISLLQLKNKIGEFVIELNALGVSCTTISVVKEFQSIVVTTSLTITQLEELNKEGSGLISQIEKQIPAHDIQEKLQEITHQLHSIYKGLEKVQFDISINTLAIEIKSNLSDQFDKAANKEDLIKQYYDQVPSTLLSYFDIPAWSRWVEDHKKYEASNREKENSFNYLTLLANKEALLSQKMRLETQKQILENLVPQIQNNSPVEIELTNLLLQAKELFQKYPFAFPEPLATNSSLTDFYLAVVCNLPLIDNKLKKMNLIRHAADELSATIHDLGELRKNYQLPPEQDVLLVRQCELEEQIKLLPSEEVLAKWINLCKSFLESDARLELLLRQLQECQATRSNINVQIDKAVLVVPDASLIKSIEEEFFSLQNEIASNIRQVKTLELEPASLEMNSASTTMSKEELLDTNKQNDSSCSTISEPNKLVPSIGPSVLLLQPEIESIGFTPLIVEEPPKTTPEPFSPQLIAEHTMTSQREIPVELVKDENNLESPMHASSGINERRQLVDLPLTPNSTAGLVTNIASLLPTPEERSKQPGNIVGLRVLIESPELTILPDARLSMLEAPIISTQLQQSMENTALTELPILTVPVAPREMELPRQQLSSLAKPLEEAMQPTDSVDMLTSVDLSNQISPQQQTTVVIGSTSTRKLPSTKVQEALIPSSMTAEEPEQKHPDTTVEAKQCISIIEKPAPPPTAEEAPTLALISLPQEEKPNAIADEELQKLEDFHLQISALLVHCATDVQEWYLETGKSLGAYLIKHPTSYKPSYVLRDILFELQHSPDLNAIQAYMRLCPRPEKDLDKLLAIKPNLPQVDEPFDEENEINDAPEQFKLLYTQYLKLRERYPVEGKLLLQAIQSLRMAKMFKDTPNTLLSMDEVPSLALDPRYESLKRHRGFLRVWEIIEDLYRWIVGIISGQAEHEYCKRPCLFSTKTAQLLDEADLMVQKDLPPVCLS